MTVIAQEWKQLQPHTAGTGSTLCRSPHADCVLTTNLYEQPSVLQLGPHFAPLTYALVNSWSILPGFTVFRAKSVLHGRAARHHQINDSVYRSLSRANFPAKREPPRLLKSDCKRPDDITLIPWREGKCLAWYATVGDTFAPT